MKKLFLTIATFFALSSHAVAEEHGFYGGIDAGYARVKSSAQETANTLVNLVGGAVTVSQNTSAPVGKVFAGYNINKNFSAEVGYLLTGDFTQDIAGVSGGLVAYTGKENASASGAEFSLLIRPVTGFERLFIRAGGHNLKISSDVTLTGTSTVTAKSSVSGTGYMLGIGYDTPISKNLSYRTAYTYYDKIAGESDANAHFITIGLLAKF